ncbi:MAG: hypothetical protein JNJ61_28815 [Anaerolineae bacterium]|nr:hypothetical protein [Anaerolineae bacterium]
MSGLRRLSLVLVFALLLLATRAEVTRAAACADGDDDACWARFYLPGAEDDSRVYFRIYRACEDGIRIGIASNVADEYEFYIKQYGSGENPPFRLLTEPTTVQLNNYPAGVDIEWTDEAASGFAGVDTVYYLRVFNVGWSEVFDSDYMDGIMIGSTDYGYSEDDATGIVRSGDFENCWTFNAPFDALITPFVQCVRPGPNGSLTVIFGYYNRLRQDSIIPEGPYNRLSRLFNIGNEQFDPITEFRPGFYFNALRVSAGGATIWTIAGRSAIASLYSRRC